MRRCSRGEFRAGGEWRRRGLPAAARRDVIARSVGAVRGYGAVFVPDAVFHHDYGIGAWTGPALRS